MITPDTIAKSGTEHAIQSAFFAHIATQLTDYPMLAWMHAIPNGGDRDMRTAAKMKMEGVRSGVLDTFLPYPQSGYAGLYIEFKKPKDSELSSKQEQFISYLIHARYACAIARSWREAWLITESYLGGTFVIKDEILALGQQDWRPPVFRKG